MREQSPMGTTSHTCTYYVVTVATTSIHVYHPKVANHTEDHMSNMPTHHAHLGTHNLGHTQNMVSWNC